MARDGQDTDQVSLDEAHHLSYGPHTPSDWVAVPRTIGDGLDQIQNVAIGHVVGPASAADDFVPSFDGVTGKLVQDPGVLELQGNVVYVNHLQISGGPAGVGPLITAAGTDASVNLDLAGKGTGVVRAYSSAAYREVATISGTQTLTNKTLTTPQIAAIHDPTENTKVLELVGAASANNFLKVTNAQNAEVLLESASGHGLKLQDTGEDSYLTLKANFWGYHCIWGLTCEEGTGAGYAQFNATTYSNTQPSYFDVRRARGTIASKAALQSGDDSGRFRWSGHDGTTMQQRAAMWGEVDGAVSSGVVPMALVFGTGSSALPTERFRIASDGHGLWATDRRCEFRNDENYIYSPSANVLTVKGYVDLNLDANTNVSFLIGGTTRGKFQNTHFYLYPSGGGLIDFDLGTANALDIQAGASSRFTINATGLAFNGQTPIGQPDYTTANVTPDRSFDADTVAVAELADIVGTLIADLISYGLLQ